MIPKTPTTLPIVAIPQKQKTKKDIAKSLISGGPFPKKHQTLQKEEQKNATRCA